MALGGIVLYLQSQNSATSEAVLAATDAYSAELRVRFPLPTDSTLTPTELSGALFTLSNGALGSSYASVWYEKASASSTTGTIFLTSSAGRLEMANSPIFDGRFYNVALVRENVTGSVSVSVAGYEDGRSIFASSSVALSGTTGFPVASSYTTIEVGSSIALTSRGQFWGQEFRLWRGALGSIELDAHAAHFESYGRNRSYDNSQLLIHWRFNDGGSTDGSGVIYMMDSGMDGRIATGSNFAASSSPFTKFLLDYGYIPSIDYGWNQEKVRTFSGSFVDPRDAYRDESLVSLEFNMYDQLNEDIGHVMTSFEELGDFIGLPVNRYREDYEGLRQMRETYFKRLQGQLNFRVFVDMLDFFDTTFVSTVERLLPARSLFKGDELVVESHMLERPKYQYQLRPVKEGRIDIAGAITVADREPDDFT